MPKTKKFLTLAVATAIAGTTMLGATSATTTVTHYTDSDISYTLNSGYSTQKTFTGVGTITISDGTDTITILDRNLGATIAGTGCKGNSCPVDDPTYGYNFQWGNNYGFPPNITPTTTGVQISVNDITLPYSSDIFIVGNANWLNDNSAVDLWGGGTGEYSTEIDGDSWRVYNPSDRKGPCPEGFHVPGFKEIKKIYTILGNNIYDYLLFPFAGYRTYRNAGFYDYDSHNPRDPWIYTVGSTLRFFSSSVTGPDYPYWAVVINGYGRYYNRADAGTIRCIYDFYQTYTKAGILSGDAGGFESELFIPTAESYEVNVGGDTYNNVLPPTTTITTGNIEQVEGKPVLGEVSVSFGGNESAKFSKLVKVNIPVEDANRVIVKVQHVGSSEYNFDGLTLNRNATCNDNGRPTSNQYNGEIITVVDGYASIYTCEASSFIALGLGSGEAIGEVTLTLTAGENTCTLNDYNLGTHNVSSEDQNVSTSGQDIVCEFLKNTRATIQLSMGDLVDGTKEIGRQYFTGIVSPLGNPLGTIANLTGGSYNFSGSHIIYTKQANTIGTWTGSLAIEGIIPAGTPSGEYTGELNVIICEGC